MLIELNNNVISIDLSQLSLQGFPCTLTLLGVDIGFVTRNAQGLIIKLQQTSAPIILKGTCKEQSLSICSQGDLTINADLQIKQLEIKSHSLALNTSINAEKIKFESDDKIMINKNLTADVLEIKSDKIIESMGSLSAHSKLKIRTPHYIDHGICHADKKLSIKTNEIESEQQSQITSDAILKIKAEKWRARGQVLSKQLAYINARNIVNDGRISLPKLSYLQAENAEMLQGGDLITADSQGNVSSSQLKIDNKFILHAGSHLHLNNSALVARKLKVAGEFSSLQSTITAVKIKSHDFAKTKFTESILQAQQKLKIKGDSLFTLDQSSLTADNILLDEHGDAKLHRSSVKVTKNLNQTGESKLDIDRTKLTFKTLDTKKDSQFSSKNSEVTGVVMQNQGACEFSDSEINSDFYTDAAKTYLNHSRITAIKRFEQKEAGQLHMDKQSIIASELVNIKGNATLREGAVAFAEKNLTIDGKITTNGRTLLKAQTLSASAKSTVKLNDSGVIAENIILKGDASVNKSSLKAKDFNSQGKTHLNESGLDVDNRVTVSGQFNALGSTLSSRYMKLAGQYQIEQSTIDTKEMEQQDKGILKNNRINTRTYETDRLGHSKVENTHINAENCDLEGGVSISKTTLKAANIDQGRGAVDIAGSRIEIRDSLTTEEASRLTLEASIVEGGQALLESDIAIKSAEVKFKDFSSVKSLSMLDSKLISEALHLAGVTDLSQKTLIQTDNCILEGSNKFDHSTLEVKANLAISGSADIQNSRLRSGTVQNFGSVTANKSSLTFDAISIYKQLKLLHSKLESKEIHVTTIGDLSSQNADISATKLVIDNTAQLERTQVTASDSIHVNHGGHLKTDESIIKADNKIAVSVGANVTGSSVVMKTNKFRNRGNIALTQSLHIDAEKVSNVFGSIDGGQFTKIDANCYLLNFFGSVKGSNTQITTPINLNIGSHVNGSNSLTVNSLLDFNAFGLYSGYNVNLSNILGFNGGLVLPSLPSSWSAIFSTQHLLNVFKAGLTTYAPAYTNLINLGFQAAPMLINGASKLYDVTVNKTDWRELLPSSKLFSRDARLVDWIPTILSAYNLGMMGYSLYNSSIGSIGEFKHFQENRWQDLTKNCNADNFFTNLSNFQWESLKPDLSPINLANFAYASAMAVGPSQNIQSMFNVNAGLTFSNSATQTSLFSLNAGLSVGLQSFTQTDYGCGFNYGYVAANKVTMTGGYLDNSGGILANDHLYINYNEIDTRRSSLLVGNNASIYSSKMNHHGNANFDFISGKIDDLSMGLQSNLSLGGGRLSTNHVVVEGNLHIKDFYLDNHGDFLLAQDGNLIAERAIIKSENFVAAQGSHSSLNQSAVDASNNMRFDSGSYLEGYLSQLKSKSGDYLGETNFRGSVVEAEHLRTGKDNKFTATSALVTQTLDDGSQKEVEQFTVLKAATAEFAGENKLSRTVIEVEDKISVAEQGRIELEMAAMSAKEIVAQGALVAKTSSIKANDAIVVTNMGQLGVDESMVTASRITGEGAIAARSSHLMADHLTIKDRASFEQSKLEIAKTTDFTKSSEVSAADTVIETTDFKAVGNTTLAAVSVDASETITTGGQFQAHGIKREVKQEDGSVKETTSVTNLRAQEINLGSTGSLEDTSLVASQTIKVAAHADVSTHNATLEANALKVHGKLQTDQSAIKTNTTIDVSRNGSFSATECSIKTKEINNAGKLTLTATAAEVAGNITNATTGDMSIQGCQVNANRLQNAGHLLAQNNELNLKESLSLEKGSNNTLKDNKINTKNASLDGKVEAEKNHLAASGLVTIKETAELKSHDNLVEGKDIKQNGNITYTGYLGLNAQGSVVTGDTSQIKIKNNQQPNLLHITGATAELSKGKVNVDNVDVVVDHLPGAISFISRKDRYVNFVVTDNLSFSTQESLDLLEPINRQCGLDLTAHSIRMKTDYKTKGNLNFTSTDGDIRLFSNLTAQNIVAASAKDLYTTKSVKAQDTVNLEAKRNYDNVGGNITADKIYEQAKRIRNISGDALKNSNDKKAQDEKAAKKSNKSKHKDSASKDPLQDLDLQARQEGGAGGLMMGSQVYLNATGSNIENYGGVIKGTDYFQGIAKKDIINYCNVKKEKGKYDTIKTFDPGIMGGGKGLDGIGMYLKAGGKVINDGSKFESIGSNYIQADKGLESKTRHHTFISKYKERSTWYGSSQEEIQTSTKVGTAQFVSSNGENIIIVDNGKIYAEATHFLSQKGTKAYAKDNIELYDLKYTDTTYKSSSALWGLSSSSSKKRHEQAEPVLIYDHGVSILESKEGSVIGRGLVVMGQGDFYTIAKNGSVQMSSQKLSHSIREKRRAFSASLSTFEHLKSLSGDGGKKALLSLDPTFQKVKNLMGSDNSQEWFANSWNTALSGYNTYQNLLFAQQNGLLGTLAASQLGIASPTVDFNFSRTDNLIEYETQGPGQIHRNNWGVEAKEVHLKGGDVDIAENMDVQAQKFLLEGHELKSKARFINEKLTIGVGAGGVNNVSGSHQRSETRSRHYQNQQNKVGGTLSLRVDEMTLDAANIDTGDIQGFVNTLREVSRQDTTVSRQQSLGFNTNGQGSYQQSSEESRSVAQASGIHVRNGINHDEQHQFAVHRAVLEGAKITSDGENKFKCDHLEAKDIKDVRKERSFGISGNLNDVVRVVNPGTENPAPKPNSIATATVAIGKTDHAGVHQATVFGDKLTQAQANTVRGNLNTQNQSGYKVTRDKTKNVSFDIPLPALRLPVQIVDSPLVAVQEEHVPQDTNQKEVAEVKNGAVQSDVLSSNTDVGGHSIAGQLARSTNDSSQADTVSLANDLPKPNAAISQTRPLLQSPLVNNIVINGGLKTLEISYDQIEKLVERNGAPGVAKIFKGLGLGVSFTQNYIEAKENNSSNPLVDAAYYTFADHVSIINSPAKLAIDGAAAITKPMIDSIEKNDFTDFSNQAMLEKFGNLTPEEMLWMGLDFDAFERPTIIESYGMAKFINFLSTCERDAAVYLKEKFFDDPKPVSENPNGFFHQQRVPSLPPVFVPEVKPTP